MNIRCNLYLPQCSNAKKLSGLFRHLRLKLYSLISQNVFAIHLNLSFHNHFSLKDQSSVFFDATKIQNKTALLNFIDTQSSTFCSLQSSSLVDILMGLAIHLKYRVTFISVSQYPIHDTPEQFRKYLSRHQLTASNWLLVTRPLNDISILSKRLKLYGQVLWKNAQRPYNLTYG